MFICKNGYLRRRTENANKRALYLVTVETASCSLAIPWCMFKFAVSLPALACLAYFVFVVTATEYMESGAAYGNGIYMADEMSIALEYAARAGPGSHWPMARTTEKPIIIAVCEVVDR